MRISVHVGSEIFGVDWPDGQPVPQRGDLLSTAILEQSTRLLRVVEVQWSLASHYPVYICVPLTAEQVREYNAI